MIKISISSVIDERIRGIKFGMLSAVQVSVNNNDPGLTDALAKLEKELREKFTSRPPSDNEIVGHVRRMYRRIGWEPTRYRPSSEALIRRILKEKGLYRINNLVDYGNIVSASYHLPMGLYDTEKIEGDILFDVGKSGESYRGISKDKIHAEGKLILRDKTGIFGNPTADSSRTAISDNTASALAIFFCPPEVSDNYLRDVLDELKKYYENSCPDAVCESSVFIP